MPIPPAGSALLEGISAMKNYRKPFWIVLVVNFMLIASLGFLWWRTRSTGTIPIASIAPSESSVSQGGPPPNVASPETPLAAVQLSPQRLQSIGAKTGEVEMKWIHDEIRATGNVEIDEERQAYVQVRFPGWIQKVYANATYQHVRKGEPLFTIYSPDLVSSEEEYLLARQKRGLVIQSAVPGVASGATSLVASTEERLRHWGIPASEIAQLESTGKVRREMAINSPVSGYITERNALPNMYVQPETRLYTIADLSTIWVNAEVPQNDVGKVRVEILPRSQWTPTLYGRFEAKSTQSCLKWT